MSSDWIDNLIDKGTNDELVSDTQNESWIDTLVPSAKTEVKEHPTNPPSYTDVKPKDFYSTMPALTGYMGKMGYGPKPESGFSESGVPLS